MFKTKKVGTLFVAFSMAVSTFSTVLPKNYTVLAAEQYSGELKSVTSAVANKNIVDVVFNDNVKGRITFLEDGIFRYNVDPSGEFSKYAKVRGGYPDTAKIQAQPDTSKNYKKPNAKVKDTGSTFEISVENGATIVLDKATAKMSIKNSNGEVVMEESKALSLGNTTTQSLVQHSNTNYSDALPENFYGGGTQNGRIVHTGKAINISNESKWNDGDVSSPNPFYYSTNGYGVLRNTYQDGKYDFGSTESNTVTAMHNEHEFDAYYFVSDKQNGSAVTQDLLREYFKVTGNPVLLPEYGFYLGHLNAYNRDAWSDKKVNDKYKRWDIKGNSAFDGQPELSRYENGGTGTEIQSGEIKETLNGTGPTVAVDKIPENINYDRKFSAQNIVDEYLKYDMPFGYLLPNDGYGAGYGQNGYNKTGGVDSKGNSSKERLAAVAANVDNLRVFADYAKSKGVQTGLWTQSNLKPDSNEKTPWHLLRDFEAEVKAGVTTLKTDVAWVGNGYSFQLSGVKQAYDTITNVDLGENKAHTRPNIISLDGWAGSQRYNSVWTGDQTGGKWEYIRFHIPTFIGQSLSGNPNIGSDMDGIWGGAPEIATRDYQWKSFAPQMLDMDGWGTYMKSPYTHGDPYTGISRMYLKTKAQLMPYIYTNAYAAANIDTGNNDTGLPMMRAMFLEYPAESLAYGDASKYQYMWGKNLLVAPVYENTKSDDAGNDVRNGIYLPGGEKQIWIDYFTGEQYRGGQILNNFDAPIWKLPLFVKNGAIIPMYAEHNVADSKAKNGVDKTKRIIEFWPEGTTDFTAIEDDGSFIENKLDSSDQDYGVIDNIDYGKHVSTKYTSDVKNGVATLTAEKSTGEYTNYEPNKDTTFVVHASKKPGPIEAYNGNTKLSNIEVTSKEKFDTTNAENGKVVVFYDANPKIETYASQEETKIADMVKNVEVSGKLYVKFAKADTKNNEQKVVIKGFENKGDLEGTGLNENLETPKLSEDEDAKTPTSITLNWNKVNDATSYEVLVDGEVVDNEVKSGVINKILANNTTFTHTNLAYKSAHSYYIRSVNKNGHSNWSEKLATESADDPWRLTPKPESVKWTGGYYHKDSAQAAFNQTFESGDSGFHSDNTALNSTLTVDYGKGYLFDKIEYYHRSGRSNGVVTKMKVETSLDGIHWTAQEQYNFASNDDAKLMDLKDPKTGANSIGARYIRFTPIESIGNFFHAYELKTYTVEENVAGSSKRPFKIGNPVDKGMEAASLDSFRQIYQKDSSAHKSDKDQNWVGEIQKVYADINNNGYADIYDYAFTAFEVDGGTKKKGEVSGNILLETANKTAKPGETFKVNVLAVDVNNLNAYGSIIHYDQNLLEYVDVDYVGTEGMYTNGMTGNIVYNDEAYINHNAINMGDKKLINGSKVLATITMKVKNSASADVDLTDKNVIDLTKTTLMGPDFSTIVTDTTKKPDIPTDSGVSEKTIEYQQNDFDITMTNKFMPTDDGHNVEKLIQQKSYNNLFNNVKHYQDGKVFEFLWNYEPNFVDGKFPEYVTLPTTIHFNFKEAKELTKFDVYNRESGNGSINSIKAVVRFQDGSTEEFKGGDYDKKQPKYSFVVSPKNASKKVAGVDITPLTADGKQMLTICEIDFLYTRMEGTAVTSIESSKDNKQEVYVGYLEDVNAKINPENATNKFFKVESLNPDIADIVTLTDKNGHPIYKVRGVKAGEATIKLTAAANEKISTEYKITVKEGVDKTKLTESIDRYQIVTDEIYTKDSYAAFKAAFDKAVSVKADPNATRTDVEKAVSDLDAAFDSLKAVLSDKELSQKIVTKVDGAYSENNTANKMFDGQLNTYWETPYGSQGKLPREAIIQLDQAYYLEQLTFVSHVARNGGVTDYAIEVSEDNKNWIPVAVGKVDYDAYTKGENVTVNARFKSIKASYVKFIVKGSVGANPNEDNQYGRIAEMKLYGSSITDKSELQNLVDKVESTEKGNYTDSSWNKFQQALQKAKEVLLEQNPSKQDVENAKNNLQTAFDGLAENAQADKSSLKELVEKADKIKRGEYTETSWNQFQQSLKNAKEVLSKENASQEEVEAAKINLQNMMDRLEKENVNPIDPDKPVNPDKPDTGKPWEDLTPSTPVVKPEVPSTPIVPIKPEQPNNEKVENEEKPNTGVSTNTALLWTMVLGAGAAVVLLANKKRKEQR